MGIGLFYGKIVLLLVIHALVRGFSSVRLMCTSVFLCYPRYTVPVALFCSVILFSWEHLTACSGSSLPVLV